MYINPTAYFEVHKKKDDEFSKKNAFFDKQSKVGRETGKLYLPPSLADSVRKAMELKKKIYSSGTFMNKPPKGGGVPTLG